MSFDVWSELVDLRERMAVIETTLLDIRRLVDKLDKHPAPGGGNLIVPVSVIIVLVQAASEAIKHFL